MKLTDLHKHLIERITVSGECWEWTGSYSNKKHIADSPMVRLTGKYETVRNYLYRLIHDTPTKFKTIKSTCDNHKCVNPEHYIKLLTEEEVLQNKKDYINKYRKDHKELVTESYKLHMKKKKQNRIKEPIVIKSEFNSDVLPYKIYRVKNPSQVVVKRPKKGLKGRDVGVNNSDFAGAGYIAAFLFMDQAMFFGDEMYPNEYFILDESPVLENKAEHNGLVTLYERFLE